MGKGLVWEADSVTRIWVYCQPQHGKFNFFWKTNYICCYVLGLWCVLHEQSAAWLLLYFNSLFVWLWWWWWWCWRWWGRFIQKTFSFDIFQNIYIIFPWLLIISDLDGKEEAKKWHECKRNIIFQKERKCWYGSQMKKKRENLMSHRKYKWKWENILFKSINVILMDWKGVNRCKGKSQANRRMQRSRSEWKWNMYIYSNWMGGKFDSSSQMNIVCNWMKSWLQIFE